MGSYRSFNLSFRLGVSDQVALGVYPLRVTNRVGSTSINIEVISEMGQQLPYQVTPSIISLAPDSVYRQVVLRAAQTSTQERSFALATGSQAIARVRNAMLVLPAGQVEATIAIAGGAAGSTLLSIQGADMATPLEVPVNVVTGGSGLFRVSPAVGLIKGSGLYNTAGYFFSRQVGISKGVSIPSNGTTSAMSAPVGLEKGWSWSTGNGIWVSRPIGIVKQ